jgi:hypothetical protein
MGIKFTLTEKLDKYTNINGEWGDVYFDKVYVINNWDDLQNLIMTLVDYSEDGTTLKFEVKKETFDEEVDD